MRLFGRGDGPALFDAVNTHRASILPWMLWAKTDHETVADSIYFVENNRRAAARADCRRYNMGIFDRKTGEVLGGTGLHGIDSGTLTGEIGYWVAGHRQGQGVCSEAVGGLISQALKAQRAGGWGLRRITVFTATDNTASQRVCHKLGLRLESRTKLDRRMHYEGEHGVYCDSVGFAVLADEWDFEAHRAQPNIGWESFDPATA